MKIVILNETLCTDNNGEHYLAYVLSKDTPQSEKDILNGLEHNDIILFRYENVITRITVFDAHSDICFNPYEMWGISSNFLNIRGIWFSKYKDTLDPSNIELSINDIISTCVNSNDVSNEPGDFTDIIDYRALLKFILEVTFEPKYLKDILDMIK